MLAQVGRRRPERGSARSARSAARSTIEGMARERGDELRLVCGGELFSADFTEEPRARLRPTFFAAALDESVTAPLVDRDTDSDAIKVFGVAVADFRQICDFLVAGRAPLIEAAQDYGRLLAAADYVCVDGFAELRRAPELYAERSLLIKGSWSGKARQDRGCIKSKDGAEATPAELLWP